MAHIDIHCTKAIEIAKQLTPNITIQNGINWIWATGFDSKDKANEFNKYCENNGCETRGVYNNNIKGLYDVRFR